MRADARAVLASWDHPDPVQRALRDDYIAFIDTHDDAVWRRCLDGHITASALVMNASRTRVLLTLHPKVGRFIQLGGHCEPTDESLREAARREVREESGIDDVRMSAAPIRLDRHGVPCGGRPSEHLDVQYLAVVPDDAIAVMSAESDDLQWFELGESTMTWDPAVRALIGDAERVGPLHG